MLQQQLVNGFVLGATYALFALGFGSGAESRRPLGLAVVGGLLTSQVL